MNGRMWVVWDKENKLWRKEERGEVGKGVEERREVMADWPLLCQSHHQPSFIPSLPNTDSTRCYNASSCITAHHITSHHHVSLCSLLLTLLIFILRLDCYPFFPSLLSPFLLTYNLACPCPRSSSLSISRWCDQTTQINLNPPTHPIECRTIFMVY